MFSNLQILTFPHAYTHSTPENGPGVEIICFKVTYWNFNLHVVILQWGNAGLGKGERGANQNSGWELESF